MNKIGSLRDIELLSILDGDTISYGGRQAWFQDDFYRKVGCGIIAAANQLYYLRTKLPQNIKKENKDLYLSYLDELIKYLQPHEQLGIPSALYWMEAFRTYGLSKNLQFSFKWKTNNQSYADVRDFILQGLREDIPLSLLMFKNPKLSAYDWHWMTITGYSTDSNGIEYITISSWGECHQINLAQVYNYSSYAAFIYPIIREE